MPRHKTIIPRKPTPKLNVFLGPKGSMGLKELIVEDHHVLLHELEGTNVLESLRIARLDKYCGMNMPTIPHLVHWFYKYVKFEFVELHSWSMVVPSRDGFPAKRYTDKDFAREFSYFMISPNAQYDFFTDYENISKMPPITGIVGKEGLAKCQNGVSRRTEVTADMNTNSDTKYFDGDRKLMAMIVTKVLLPSMNKDNVLSYIHALVVEMLITKCRVNMGMLMALHMRHAIGNKKSKSVPFGGFITRIMKDVWRLDIPGPGEVRQQRVIRRFTYERQGSLLVGSSLVQEWELPSLSEEDQRAYVELKNAKGARAGTSKGKKRAHIAEEHDDEEPFPHEFVSEGPSDGPSMGREGYFQQRLDEIREAQREMALEQASIVVTQRAIMEENRHIKESQGLIMRLLKKIGSKCGCTDVELNEP